MKKRLVVKIGSSLLTQETGRLSLDKLGHHVDSIVAAKEQGHDVVLVSSGAVAAGFDSLGFSGRPDASVAKQACAAVGQGLLIRAYTETFGQYGLQTAQVLLGRRDFAVRESYNNALAAFGFLLERGVVPVVNENDTVATEELVFGDNDILAALVAALLHADQLIIFTDIPGLYTADPGKHADARRLDLVPEVTNEILELGGASGTKVGTGGMEAKLKAAEFAVSMGVQVFIGDGRGGNSKKVLEVLTGEGDGTYFGSPDRTPVARKKQWIAFHSEIGGKIVIDSGAFDAMSSGGKSLLPVGVTDVFGDFKVDDVVEVIIWDGTLVGKGVVQYSAGDLRMGMGKQTDFAKTELDLERVEVIHRDNFVLL